MKLLPEYSLNIVVAVVHDKRWLWLVTEKEDWFLDYPKWRQAFADAGYALAADSATSERCGIDVLDQRTIGTYLERMKDHIATVPELNELVSMYEPLEKSDEILAVVPTLLVNFDKKRLVNCFPEPGGAFEGFMPEGWTGQYRSFLDEVTDDQKYWIVGGRDYFLAGSGKHSP